MVVHSCHNFEPVRLNEQPQVRIEIPRVEVSQPHARVIALAYEPLAFYRQRLAN